MSALPGPEPLEAIRDTTADTFAQLPSIENPSFTPTPNKRQNVAVKPLTAPEQRRQLACESCHRLKLKCDASRPCQTCTRRGTACIPKVRKTRSCLQCRMRKIKCDLQQPCKGCVESNRTCSTNSPAIVTSPVTSSSTITTENSVTPFRNEVSFEAGPNWLPNVVLDESDPFGLASFQFDDFPSLSPFWPDPLFQSPPTSLTVESSTMDFDDFDRSRILHDLEEVPDDQKGELPSCARLSTILRQYFQFVNPYSPVIHVPSFGVKTAPTPFLLLLLAIGDMYSEQHTLERWARKSFRYLLRVEVEKYENSESELSLTTIQALNMWVYELVYISLDETKSVLQAAHCRATLSHACQKLQQDEEIYRTRKQEGDDEIAWINWIRSETRRRTLMSIYTTETVISMYLGVAPQLRVSQLKVPLPESDELWYAESHQQWQQLRRCGRRGSTLQFNEVLSDLMNAGTLVREYNGVVGLHVIMIGIEELIVMARRLREVDGDGHVCSRALMAKSREALEAWKSSWQTSQSQRITTKAQYIAIMSAWCCAELSLTAPDVLLGMVYRVSTTKDRAALMKKFLREVDDATKHLDLNQLLSTAAAAISHVESLAEFGSVEECLSVIETTVYPSVITSIFEGGLTLWFSVRIFERVGRYIPRAEKEILPRLLKAVDSIGWATDLRKNSIATLLGEILMQMKVWKFSKDLGRFLRDLPS